MNQEKKPKILCVDDNKLNTILLQSALTPEGYEFQSADSGEAALSQVAKDPPDIILLDIIMPKMSGFEVLQKLRADEKTRFIPVVMLTALSETEDKVKALEAGCDDFMSKPFDKVELLARVKSLVRVKAYHDQMQNYERSLADKVAQRTRSLWRALKEKDNAHLEIIYRLSRAAECRDEDTGTHILRIGYYARTIANKMSLKDKFTEAIFYASPMHDIGKIGIPDSILHKSAKLNPGEWEIMKRHTTIGAQILKGSKVKFIKVAEIIALTHHEKWDGSGYPEGLKGAKISLAGRITAIADVFDAATSRRPYKEPCLLEKAFEIIKKGAGSHFDPHIVSAFFACQDEIIKLKEKYKDQNKAL